MHIQLHVKANDPSLAPLRAARDQAARLHADDYSALARRARTHYGEIASTPLPSAVREPLTLVPALADLIEDANWRAGDEAKRQFAGALAYFIDPDDLIPDAGNHFGYLDDALVLKLTLADAHHEWFAWCDYRDYLAAYPEDAGIDRETWLLRRRERLETELRRRNEPGSTLSRRERGSYLDPQLRLPRFGVR